MTQPPDPAVVIVTAQEAADEIGLSRAAIYNWVRREYIKPVAKRGALKLFRLSDVFEVEKNRRHEHRRRSQR